MKTEKKCFCIGLAISMSLASCFALSSCKSPDDCKEPETKYVIGTFLQEDYLKVDGEQVRKNYGNGEEIKLRGTNAGGYLLMEQWMTVIKSPTGSRLIDHKWASELFADRFGEETMQEIWAEYRANFWTEQDFQNCADMGMTVIRLPFSYMNVDFNGNYDFGQLDTFIEGAAKYGIYTILDMHGAYGSQNGQDHSGEIFAIAEQVDFFRNELKMSKTVALWRALAEHYWDNPAVAAFDILNEPGAKGDTTNEVHWAFYDRVYDAIREIDEDRIVIFESCWGSENLPRPERYGWNNCMYSYHLYHGSSSGGVAEHGPRYREEIALFEAPDYGVPNYMGEFTCYSDSDVWEDFLGLLNERGWHWTNWTYKIHGNMTGWGIVSTRGQGINPATDEQERIFEKLKAINTAAETTYLTMLQDGEGQRKTLKQLITEACKI